MCERTREEGERERVCVDVCVCVCVCVFMYLSISVSVCLSTAGQSVLRWFQGQMTHGTIVGEELFADLTWNVYFLYWSITVTGQWLDE